MSTDFLSEGKKPTEFCCNEMKQALGDLGFYEDDMLIISRAKNTDGVNEYNYMCYVKAEDDTLPLGACLWCGKELL